MATSLVAPDEATGDEIRLPHAERLAIFGWGNFIDANEGKRMDYASPRPAVTERELEIL